MAFFLIVLSSFAVAELAITEPEDTYNLGDRLYVTATGLKGYEEGNLNIDLRCDNITVNLLKLSARAFPEDGGQAYSIPYKILSNEDLEITDVSDLVGLCSIKANLANEVIESKQFTISNEVSVSASADKIRYNPGDTITLEISASRADGAPFIGEYETGNFTVITGSLTEEESGEIVETIKVPSTKAPGSYLLDVSVFDNDKKGDILNNGSFSVLLMVNQVATTLEPAISAAEVVPTEDLTLNPRVLDQAGNTMPGTITLYLEDPEGRKHDYSVVSGETLSIPFPENATKGIWSVFFVYTDMTAETTFTMQSYEKVNYSLTNSVLTIINVGNTEYFGVVTVNIGESAQEVEVRLPVGSSKEFILEAPEGEYEISVGDGSSSFSGTGFLTGNAVNVKERGAILPGKLSLMWIFLVFLGGSLIVVMVGLYQRTKKGDKTSFTQKMKGGLMSGFTKVQKTEEPHVEVSSNGMITIADLKGAKHAESALVVDGQKVDTTVVAIKLKDKDAFTEEIQKELVKIITNNCGPKGVVDVKGDFIYLIYSPLISRSYRNEFLATSIAVVISDQLKNYTKNLSGELKFGIGITTGPLVSQKVDNKLRYTSMGNTFTFANKMAEAAENDVLVGETIRKHLLRDIRSHKAEAINGHQTYAVEVVKNRTANEAKLKDLLSRMSKD